MKPREDLLSPGVTGRQLGPRPLGLSGSEVGGPSSTLTYPSVLPHLLLGQRAGGCVKLVGPRNAHQRREEPTAVECWGEVWTWVCRRTLSLCPALQCSGRWGLLMSADVCNDESREGSEPHGNGLLPSEPLACSTPLSGKMLLKFPQRYW